MTYIATFFSHFGARAIGAALPRGGHCGRGTMPVPRSLSSSCGTCVRCEGSYLTPEGVCAEEIERIVRVEETGFCEVYPKEDGHGD